MEEETQCVRGCAGTGTFCCCWYKPCDGPFREDSNGFNWWFVCTVGLPCNWPFICGAGCLAFAGTTVALAASMCCCCFCCGNEKQQGMAVGKAWRCCKSTCCCFIPRNVYQ